MTDIDTVRMSTPLVSVIVPNYNHNHFLAQRLDSILNQTFQDFELIILDDCSTDNSRDIIEKYRTSEKVSHVIYNEKNSGSPFLQWQKGLSLARGEYIWIAESDDYSDLIFLEKMIFLLKNNLSCNISYCCSHLIDENGNILPIDWDRNKQERYAVNVFDGKQFLKARMLFDNSIYNAGMAVFRKSAYKNIGNEFTKYTFCGDWYFWNKICIQGTVIRYCDKLNYFRQHSDKVTPRADSEGIKFIEGKYVFKDVMDMLSFSKLQNDIAVGKFTKRIKNFKLFKNENIREKVLDDVCNYLKASYWNIFIYELDKFFNFSSLNLRKNKYI
ncbi:glycosyltransferase involved in cell wall biosynthesis [Dysgonomonas hofstadii]|uniref:Glycosyltransferase involved in cell wall biosynthesis n=1 Tax=Dysgonomonas hofstadii TaxID=637886 RepID=A0A840CKK0_9BACT|nr:glycosyltransferase [Dysgonomonas hofstadii]MBB4035896.1 glycosyltransferase involved in cell wall biosynthesis [Dysgonomonas hofstadii]